MSEKSNLAVEYFGQKLHCSQAVLLAFAEECGLTGEQAIKAGSCLGSGMRKGEVCGALTGALVALGLIAGQCAADDLEGRARSNRLNDEMMDRFSQCCGSWLCKDLLGCDIATEAGLAHARSSNLFTTRCPVFVEQAALLVEEILEGEK